MKKAKILPFARRPKVPMEKAARDQFSELLLELAADVEAGKVAECCASVVYADGKTGIVYAVPRDWSKLLVSVTRARTILLKMFHKT